MARKLRAILSFVPFVLILGVFGCQQSLTQPAQFSAPAATVTGISPEAQRMALLLSGDLYPPVDLVAQLQSELAQIRSDFGQEDSIVNRLAFRLPYLESCIMIRFSPDSARSIAHGTYHDWDALNREYGLVSTDSLLWNSFQVLVLHFGQMLHSGRLADLYRTLPGALYTEVNARIGDWPDIYPMISSGGNTYLFREASGDCPSGCLKNDYWYFVFENGAPRYVGHYSPGTDPQAPDWWAQAQQNETFYWQHARG